MALFIQQIPPLQTAYGSIDREIQVIGFNCVDTTKEMIFPYIIKYSFNGEDVSKDFKPSAKPFEINNNKLMLVRDENFQPIPNPEYAVALAGNQLSPTIPNPEYVDEETTPGVPVEIQNPEYVSDSQLAETGEFLLAPGYDYVVGIVKEHPELIWTILGNYILENADDGWYEN